MRSTDGVESTGEVHSLVDHLFRRSAGRMVAALTRVFGAGDLDLAEEVVQEALTRALQRWPFHGVPDDPEAWLLAVARNRALDRLRRRGTHQAKQEALGRAIEAAAAGAGEPPPEPYLTGEPSDDQLRLLFLCCHPALPRDARVALTLKAACGFGVDEIAAAFLDKPTTVAQRLVRAKKTLRERRPSFDLPPPERLGARLDSVLEVLYLLFNEGYAAHGGGPLVRAELCQEALRLTARLARLASTARPEVHALLALMLFQSSRLPARVDGEGRLVLLADQDRGLWDRRAVAAAFRHLERAAAGDRETPYHLQAAIASHHAAAASPEATDWPAMLLLYDRLLALQPTPVVALNRAVAVARVAGPAAALAAVDALDPADLAAYAPYHATRARLLADLGRPAEALAACHRAAELAGSEPERRFLEEMAAGCEARRAPGSTSGIVSAMRLSDLVDSSHQVAEVAGKKAKVGLLAELLGAAGPQEAATAVAYLSGRLPQGRIGVGPAALRQAAAVEPAAEPGLSVAEVDRAFSEISAASGPGSAALKAERLGELMARATASEQRFLARLVLGELRQGALEGLVAEAVAAAAELPLRRVRRAAMLAGDLPAVARAALEEGEAGLGRFSLELFRPLSPMLAQPVGGVGEALERLGEAALEHKLDGARIQAHKEGDEVRVYSRRLHEVTAAVPEVVEAVRALPARTAILDGEVIALRPDGTPNPFQVTMRRFGRRLEVERMREELPLSSFFFDLLHLEGGDLIDEPQRRRFAALAELAPPEALIPHAAAADPAAAEAFLRSALERGHEGVMAKDPAAPYAAGGRGAAWLKVKPVHTLDLVVLAAEWGHGRRKGWLSNLHLGARDDERAGFVMLGKTFKGLTDATLEWQTREIQARETGRDRWTVYARPELVVEIAFNDLQESPRYPGGLALRFARVLRYRPDKTAAEADAFAAVRDLYRRTTGREPPPRR